MLRTYNGIHEKCICTVLMHVRTYLGLQEGCLFQHIPFVLACDTYVYVSA